MTRFSILRSIFILALLVVLPFTAQAQEIRYDILGVDEPLLTNVRGHVESSQLIASPGGSRSRTEKAVIDAEERAKAALRPYGYYHPSIEATLKPSGANEWTVTLDIDAGPPILVAAVNVDIIGDGAKFAPLLDWQTSWPLPVGAVLDQEKWDGHKKDAIEIALAQGYLQAGFSRQTIELDLVQKSATLNLTFETGSRSVMGTVKYDQDVLKPAVLDNIPRFDAGDPYSAYLMEKFRTDLWKTGYFTAVEVLEKPRKDISPPVVDLEVSLETETRNSYQGSVGFGTDTQMRLQARWTRHPVSSYGDRIEVGIGWQQLDNEYLLRPIYRIPRRTAEREYWTSEILLKTEQQEFDYKLSPEDEDKIRLAEGRINDFLFRGGRLKIRNKQASGDQALETIFFQYLVETKGLDLIPGIAPVLTPMASDIDFESRLRGTSETLSVGIEWDSPSIRGKGFETVGKRDRAWAFGSSKSWGSELGFMQVYAATHRNYNFGNRWKILVRAEAGYTDAKVDEFTVDNNGTEHRLEVTSLPDLYRFRAGGSKSVRGYGFEDLSDNDLGSNNIFTASAEIEMKFLERWSFAAFLDIGNAFNDWSDPGLKKGAGVGIRWYSIAGPIRLDVARALDFEGKPWRIHFTIGTPLL